MKSNRFNESMYASGACVLAQPGVYPGARAIGVVELLQERPSLTNCRGAGRRSRVPLSVLSWRKKTTAPNLL